MDGIEYITYEDDKYQGALDICVGEHKVKIMFEREDPLRNLTPFLSSSVIAVLPDHLAEAYKAEQQPTSQR